MKWTIAQENILRLYGHRGVKFCRDYIHKVFGVYRSIEATQRHASRIKALMIVYEICPECGRAAKKLNRNTGVCEACNYERLWKEQVEEEQRIIRDLQKGGAENAVLQAKRRYDAQRQKVSRLRRKAECRDFVDLSGEVSSRRSAQQKREEKPPEKELCARA